MAKSSKRNLGSEEYNRARRIRQAHLIFHATVNKHKGPDETDKNFEATYSAILTRI